ncbi:unnamed protein product [Amoebophrya sp. A25]|nr:unnamed protein product [Amoebophrya sp. A25]|eukprot:GSA25T00019514001.1
MRKFLEEDASSSLLAVVNQCKQVEQRVVDETNAAISNAKEARAQIQADSNAGGLMASDNSFTKGGNKGRKYQLRDAINAECANKAKEVKTKAEEKKTQLAALGTRLDDLAHSKQALEVDKNLLDENF